MESHHVFTNFLFSPYFFFFFFKSTQQSEFEELLSATPRGHIKRGLKGKLKKSNLLTILNSSITSTFCCCFSPELPCGRVHADDVSRLSLSRPGNGEIQIQRERERERVSANKMLLRVGGGGRGWGAVGIYSLHG